jgi:hypothetical protein
MEEAEQYYQELKTTRAWDVKGKRPITYALSSTYDHQTDQDTDQEEEKENTITITKNDLMALATQLQNIQTGGKQDSKYSWKYKPPKDGEQNVKKIFQDGEKKTYYWLHTTKCGPGTSLVNAKDTQLRLESRRSSHTKTRRKLTYKPRQHC